jgi:hypothetical protein
MPRETTKKNTQKKCDKRRWENQNSELKNMYLAEQKQKK